MFSWIFTAICSVFWCAGVFLFISSTSGTQSPNALNYDLPSGGGLSIGVVSILRMNEARATAYSGAPVAPNVLNYALPDYVG